MVRLNRSVDLVLSRANILLDKNMTAKLADFGFAIELPRVTHGKTMFTVSCVARSEGYYPSEVTSGHFSDKSDVFSYGMVCFIISGKLQLGYYGI